MRWCDRPVRRPQAEAGLQASSSRGAAADQLAHSAAAIVQHLGQAPESKLLTERLCVVVGWACAQQQQVLEQLVAEANNLPPAVSVLLWASVGQQLLKPQLEQLRAAVLAQLEAAVGAGVCADAAGVESSMHCVAAWCSEMAHLEPYPHTTQVAFSCNHLTTTVTTTVLPYHCGATAVASPRVAIPLQGSGAVAQASPRVAIPLQGSGAVAQLLHLLVLPYHCSATAVASPRVAIPLQGSGAVAQLLLYHCLLAHDH